MFDNSVFERWLDRKAEEVVQKLDKSPLTGEEMIVLVLKAQTNHFEHLDKDLREDMRRMEENSNHRFEQVQQEIKLLREDMNHRFEQVDRRFEQVDKRFEQVDRRFEQVDKRFDRVYRFMQWEAGIALAAMITIGVKLFLG